MRRQRYSQAGKALQLVARNPFGGPLLVLLLAKLGSAAHVNFATTGFLDLLLVVVIAMVAGFWQATCTSLVALICLNYFFVPPVYTLYVADPQNWVALLSFESTALIVSRLSLQREKQTRAAVLERQRMETLYRLSRRTLSMDLQQSPGPQIVADIRETVQLECVALFDAVTADVSVAGPGDSAFEDLARTTYAQNRDEDEGLTWLRVLRSADQPIGALVLRGAHINVLLADSIASIASIALERARTFEKQSQAELARRTEQLRTAVLDALAHGFKTPLTAIRAASSGLLEGWELKPDQARLVTLIDEESDKLSKLSSRLLQTARLDGYETKLKYTALDVPEFVREIANEHQNELQRHPIYIRAPKSRCEVSADRELLRVAILQIIDNAVKYSAPGSAINITVQGEGGEVVIAIHNEGPEIQPEDTPRIFERFYRGRGALGISGTGLGLSIVKKAAEAHGGRTWVHSKKTEGTTFFLSLPQTEPSCEEYIESAAQ